MSAARLILGGTLFLFFTTSVSFAARVNNPADETPTVPTEVILQGKPDVLNENIFYNTHTDLINNKLQEAILSNNPWCRNGYGFKSLNGCRTACNETYIDPGISKPINATAPVVYKLLLVTAEDYNRSEIQTILGSVTPMLPIVTKHLDKIIQICYPLHTTTVYCHKVCYPGEDFVLQKDYQLITLRDTYGFEEYHFLNRTDYCTGAVVCVKSSSTFLVVASCCLSTATLALCGVLLLNLLHDERRSSTGMVMLYHLIILVPGFVLISTKSIVVARNSYYFPMDECSVATSVQHLCFMIGCVGTNINLRQIGRIFREDRTYVHESRQHIQQAQIIARLICLLVWFIFILLTFEGDLLFYPKEFYSVTTTSCWHRLSSYPFFICYACWVVLNILATLVLAAYAAKKFIKWNDAKILPKQVLLKTCVHVLIVVFQVFFYWLFLNWILPWRTWYSLSAGVVDLCKAGLACFILVTYVWDTGKILTMIQNLCKNGCKCYQPT